MSIKQLQDEANELLYTIENIGDLLEATDDDLESLRNSAGKILIILEKDEKLRKLVLRSTNRHIPVDLKTLAVACHKALPHRKIVDDLLGAIDYYDLQDTAEELIEVFSVLEEGEQS
jgi:hypothetical protein